MGNTQGGGVDEDGRRDVPPVLLCEKGCMHRLQWVSPRSPSFQALHEAEVRMGEAHTPVNDMADAHRRGHVAEDDRAHDSDSSDNWGWYDEAATSASESDLSQHAAALGPSFGQTNPPDYILEESLSTQALWHATAARRPRQPETERKEMERVWAENLRMSKASMSPRLQTNDPEIAECWPLCSPGPRQRRQKHILSKGISSYATSVTKSFECPTCHQTSSIMVQIPKFQIVKVGAEVFAQYLIVVGIGKTTLGVWRRFSDFQKLAEHITRDGDAHHFHMSSFSWTVLCRRKRLFRCLDKEYLALKCFLLERFLHDVVFESRSPAMIRDFLGVW
mmetsp:Transcript_379/g.1243  ORF Transcript_379/g.1243 Transcript_379/m.1243 type:complete len:334 (-) Transcript_379:669-1670(-)